jgi:NAD(P)-dependent dehydrogenase (short-subunit alcohol dehydrogenase family)
MVKAVTEIEAEYSGIDILVNNAGYAQGGPLEELSMMELRRQFETNVFGLLRMSQLVLPGMRHRGQGRIINVSSVGGEVSMPGAGAYTMSKYAVESLTDTLRFEVRPFGIKVISIQPGSVATNFGHAGAAMFNPGQPDSPYAKFRENLVNLLLNPNQAPSGMPPERIAQVILDAASNPQPRTHYKVGLVAKLLPRVRRLLSDRLWDRALRMQFRFD